jgi:hypothetical protein
MSEETLKLKLPTAAKLEQIREALVEDEDWRFGRIKIDGKKPRYELPAPTREDADNVEIAKEFHGVVLVAKKNFYQSDEDKEAGKEKREKRALYVLRTGKYLPELMYISPTALQNWRMFVKQVVENDLGYFDVLVEFTAEQVKSRTTGFVWSKAKFSIVRSLTEEERTHVATMRELVLSRVQEYEDSDKLAEYEERALKADRVKVDTDEGDDSVTEINVSKQARAMVEDDDTPPAALVKESEKAAKKSVDTDEEEEKKPEKVTKKSVDTDEVEEKPESKGRTGYPDLDDDDDL